MTKDEILYKNNLRDFKELGEKINNRITTYSATFSSMDEYARQVAIEFKEWQDENLEDKRWEIYNGHDTWINPHTRQVISTSQLYEIFKSQQ